METEREKLGFFDQLIYSVQPAKYKELLKQSGKKVIAYAMVLSLCLSIMSFIIPVAGWFATFGGLDNLFTEVLPAIELQDGRLSVENKIEIGDDGLNHILVDTERVSMQVSDLDTENYISEILVAEENMIIYVSGMEAMELPFAELKELQLDNEGLASLKPFIYVVLAITFVTHIFSKLFDLLVWGVMMAVCCWGPFRLKNVMELKYTQILGLAIYAQSAASLITAFNGSVGWIPDNTLLYYVGVMASMFLLMSGLRKLEENPHE